MFTRENKNLETWKRKKQKNRACVPDRVCSSGLRCQVFDEKDCKSRRADPVYESELNALRAEINASFGSADPGKVWFHYPDIALGNRRACRRQHSGRRIN